MKIIEAKELAIKDIKIYKFSMFFDNRGYFTEPFRQSDIALNVVQMNESFSHQNVARGLHFQWNPYMGKLVRTIRGHMVDLVLDIRKNSPTFGKIITYDMPETTDYGEWIYVPPGFAHGNYFLEDTKIQYLCTGEYSPNCEYGIYMFDKEIDWSLADHPILHKNPVLSEKDRNGHTLAEWVQHEGSKYFE
jgi:dTDP-4-dehydrorhamnose 3,5-epimerase